MPGARAAPAGGLRRRRRCRRPRHGRRRPPRRRPRAFRARAGFINDEAKRLTPQSERPSQAATPLCFRNPGEKQRGRRSARLVSHTTPAPPAHRAPLHKGRLRGAGVRGLHTTSERDRDAAERLRGRSGQQAGARAWLAATSHTTRLHRDEFTGQSNNQPAQPPPKNTHPHPRNASFLRAAAQRPHSPTNRQEAPSVLFPRANPPPGHPRTATRPPARARGVARPPPGITAGGVSRSNPVVRSPRAQRASDRGTRGAPPAPPLPTNRNAGL